MQCLHRSLRAEPMPAQQPLARQPAALEEHELFRPPLQPEPAKLAAAEARKVRAMIMLAVLHGCTSGRVLILLS